MLVSSHWTEFQRFLVPPGVSWTWSECGLSHRVKCVLKDRGLIKRSASGDRWETSMSLWCYVIDHASDDEAIGAEARGQDTLDVPANTSTTTRFLHHNTATAALSRERQSTLSGDVVDSRDSNEEEMREPWRKDPTWREPTGKEKAAQHPAQARLSTWTCEDDINAARWDVDTSRTESEVAQPCGQVYYPAQGGQATLATFTQRQWRVNVPA